MQNEKPKWGNPAAVLLAALVVVAIDAMVYITWMALNASHRAAAWWVALGFLAAGLFVGLVTYGLLAEVGAAIGFWNAAKSTSRDAKGDK